jgi:hypothetical protein
MNDGLFKTMQRKRFRPDDVPKHCRTYVAFHVWFCLRFIYLGILFFIKIQDKSKRYGESLRIGKIIFV